MPQIIKSGSGTIGNLKPGWRVNEFATPVNPADAAGGTGTVSYGGSDAVESLMLIGDDVTFTDETLGSISGSIRTLSQSGLSIDVTQDNKLARFDASMNIPPVIAGSVPSALDLADQLTGTVRLAQPEGTFWSLAGHITGFDSSGQVTLFKQQLTSYRYYNNATGEITSVSATATKDAAWSDSFGLVGSEIFCSSLKGDTIVPVKMPSIPGTFFIGASFPYTANQISFKTLLNGQDVNFSMQGQPNIGATQGSGQLLTVAIDYSAETITLDSEYWSGGVLTNSTDTQSIAGLDRDAELAVFIMFRPWRGSSFENQYQPKVVICNTSNYASTVTCSLVYNTDGLDTYFDPWEIAGNIRALWRRDATYYVDSSSLEPIVAEYENPASFGYSAVPTLGEPSVGVNKNLWSWLQDACSVYKWEIAVEGDQIYARPVGGRILAVDNYSPGPTVAPSLTFTGRQVDVNYSQASVIFEGEVYDARSDDNRIISVGAGQTTTVTVASNVYLFSAINPTRVTTFVPGVGTYYVVDSTGLPIVAQQWEDYGGSVSVARSASNASGIDVTVVGPRVEIPSTTAPYSLSVSDGQNQYAALSILGSGVVYDSATLNLLTGSDPAKTPQQLALTVDNSFISTLSRAYDAGIWASIDASGPTVSLTITIPTSGISGFGMTPGSLISWGQSQYRVTSSSVGALGVSLTCVRHVTVGDFDTLWSGETVGDHDALWSDYQCKDQIVYPYKTA